MSGSELINFILAILALGAALERFDAVALSWKVIALAVSLSVLLWVIIVRLSSWIQSRSVTNSPLMLRKRRRTRYAMSVACLTIVSILFVSVGYLLVNFYTVLVEETLAPDGKAVVSIHAPMQNLKELDLRLPPKDDLRCRPFDLPGQPETWADLEMIDLEGQTPQWRLTDFVYPQKVNMLCVPTLSLSVLTLRTSQPKIEILFPNRRKNYEIYICIGGTLIWLVSLTVLWFRSR